MRARCWWLHGRLCALFGLDALCEKLVESLVKATGIASSLASPSDPNMPSQLAALRALVALAGAPESGMLGSAWAHILRCLSSLDMMVSAAVACVRCQAVHACAKPASALSPPSAPATKRPWCA